MNLALKTTVASIAAATLLTFAAPGTALADPVRWTDWKSAKAGVDGTAIGQIKLDNGSLIDVDYAGQIAFFDAPGGSSYWNGAAGTYTSAAVDNGPGSSGMLALSKAGAHTLSFSQAVDNLFFALISLNGNGYEFDHDFTIESSGPGYWGTGTLTKQVLANGKFRLTGTGEPHGVIRFNEAVSSITWTSLENEYWNGFTIGSYGAAPVAAVPEPATWALMGLGLLGIGFVGRRRSVAAA